MKEEIPLRKKNGVEMIMRKRCVGEEKRKGKMRGNISAARGFATGAPVYFE